MTLIDSLVGVASTAVERLTGLALEASVPVGLASVGAVAVPPDSEGVAPCGCVPVSPSLGVVGSGVVGSGVGVVPDATPVVYEIDPPVGAEPSMKKGPRCAAG